MKMHPKFRDRDFWRVSKDGKCISGEPYAKYYVNNPVESVENSPLTNALKNSLKGLKNPNKYTIRIFFHFFGFVRTALSVARLCGFFLTENPNVPSLSPSA